MSATGQPGVLPLRPSTAGELLDGAVTLLRVRGFRLVALGAAVAAAEQAVLFPLKRFADVNIDFWPADDRWVAWTLLVVVGFALEAGIIAGLGGPAAAIAPRALLGPAAPRPEPVARPAVGVAVVAVAAASACGLAMATLFLWPSNALLLLLVPVTVGLWTVVFGLLGLAAPAVVVDRLAPGRALRRSVGLASRGFFRTVRLRILAYLGWLLIRVAWGMGVLQLIALVYTSPSTTVDAILMAVVYLVINAVMYPMLACLDVVLHLEARMRTEGMDIALRRVLARGVDATPTLAGV